MRPNIVRVLGWLVVAHGLSHAVLPLRGSTAPSILVGDWVPVGLYMVGMVGFVVAGLGMLGLRPCDRVISPVLIVASGLSMVAIVRLGDSSLWWGGAFDAVLLVVAVWRGYGGWPVHPGHGPAWHALGLAIGFSFLGYVGAATTLWPWHRTWGSTRAELMMPLPGDQATRDPAMEIQHAVTIDAPPGEVWKWLERAFGVDVHNAAEVRPQWHVREVGDLVRATQPGYLKGLLGSDPGWTVYAIEPERAMVLGHRGAFVLLPTDDGRTRFIIRSTVSHRRIPVWAAALEFLTFELPHFIMERRMMLGIKARAEGRISTQAAVR